MIINNEIKEILTENGIRPDDGISFLLSLYFDLKPVYIPNRLKLDILTTGIIEYDNKTDTLIWKKRLFEEQMTGFEWVKEYRDSFKQINPDRAGDLNTCVARFKKFFSKYPQYRVEDIKEAVNAYFRSVSSPKYLMKSHKFIYEGNATTGSSELLTWLERVAENNQEGRMSKSNTMK